MLKKLKKEKKINKIVFYLGQGRSKQSHTWTYFWISKNFSNSWSLSKIYLIRGGMMNIPKNHPIIIPNKHCLKDLLWIIIPNKHCLKDLLWSFSKFWRHSYPWIYLKLTIKHQSNIFPIKFSQTLGMPFKIFSRMLFRDSLLCSLLNKPK